jgi:hypothetical protein
MVFGSMLTAVGKVYDVAVAVEYDRLGTGEQDACAPVFTA